MNFLARFSGWAARLSLDDVPESTVERARLQVANNLAAALAGAEYGPRGPADVMVDQAGSGPCWTATGTRLAPADACVVNATCSMAHDFDDYLFMGHTGHSSVFASLAAAEFADTSGRELLRGVLVANELAGRLGAACAVGPHNGQMWAFIHQAGAAAAYATVLGASAEQIRHAVATALYQRPHPLTAGFVDGEAKYLTAAAPAEAGIRAAQMALGGARGPDGILEAFLQDYPFAALEPMLGGLGDSWVTDTLSYKPRPGCAYLQAPLESISTLRDQRGFFADDVERITVEASLLTAVMESLSAHHGAAQRLDPVRVTFSVRYSLAVMLAEGSFGPAELDDALLSDQRPRLEAIAERIHVRHDWDQTRRVFEGIGAGVDLRPLARDLGLRRLLSGWMGMRAVHDHFDTAPELLKLLTETTPATLLGLLDSPLDWEHFDLAAARLADLRFDFGAAVGVHLRDGTTLRDARRRHPGAAGTPLEATREMVHRKLADRLAGTTSETVGDLLAGLPVGSTRQFTDALPEPPET